MNILALEPFYGGSHRAFLDGWAKHSRHHWTIIGLPAIKWKWRMRHAPLTLSAEVNTRIAAGETFDLLFCSDMLNLAEFGGLVDSRIRQLPSVVYFHENQLTYPVRDEHERDYHFAMSNIVSSQAATRLWFNSDFHRQSYVRAVDDFLRRMPDYQPKALPAQLAAKAEIRWPGIEEFPARPPRKPGPLHLLWAARWEHDKNPADFFAALDILKQQDIPFWLSVIGEQFSEIPTPFTRAKETFADKIVHWGYQQTREDYVSCLSAADVIISTADHEFFGLSVVEAIAAGVYPLLPRRLSYPEILGKQAAADFFYDGRVDQLARRLVELSTTIADTSVRQEYLRRLRPIGQRYCWLALAPAYDDALTELVMSEKSTA